MSWLRALRTRLLPYRKSGPVAAPENTTPAAGTGASEACLRPLPVPFERFVTINSDCDGSIHDLVGAAVALNSVIREEYGLPVCDSFFGKWLFECGLDGEREPRSNRAVHGSFDKVQFFERCAEWIRGFHRGWFDTTHGWAYNMSVRVAPDLTVEGGCGQAVFAAPPSWEEPAVPRYLAFRCAEGELELLSELVVRRGGEILSRWRVPATSVVPTGESPEVGVVLPIIDRASIGAWFGEGPLVLEGRAFPTGDVRVCLANIALVTEVRRDIEHQLGSLGALNIAVSNFSSHAGGLVFAVAEGQHRQYPETAYYSDVPESPHYCADLFRAAGYETIQTFAETHEYCVRDVAELAYPRMLADGTQVHDYHRYLFIPRREDGTLDLGAFQVDGEVLNPSWADTASIQIDYCLQQAASKSWCGGVIYTHLNYASASHTFMRDGIDTRTICNAPLRTALADLSARYFGLGDCAGTGERLFVAPAAMLARMSAMMMMLEGHMDYDTCSNTVRISSVHDPCLGRKVPRREDGFRDLRGLTFYVDDASSAGVTVDGDAVDALIRNPADASGRHSVTVVDTSAPAVVLGRVPVSERELVVDVDSVALEEPDGRRSAHRLSLRGSMGWLELCGWLPMLANRHYILVEYEKTTPTLRFSVELEDSSGLCVGWAEEGMRFAPQLPRRFAWNSVARHVEVLPFWQLCADCGASTAPVGRLASLRLTMEGGVGDSLLLHRVLLLRDDGKRAGRTQCFVGGRVGSEAMESVEVRIESGGVERALLLHNGFYAVPNGVPRGGIAHIEGRTVSGDIILPRGGARHEIVDDDWDIDFP
ncbi:MAG: hypothetical protein H6977_13240 [Gammaproteobacteria bacterium]|nr:hypothetical protein [Gammaproteobacteria bacterium]